MIDKLIDNDKKQYQILTVRGLSVTRIPMESGKFL